MFLSFCVGGIILVWVANFVSDFDAGTSIVIVIIAIILVISGLHGYIVSESNNSNSGKSSEQLIQETQDEDQKENHEKDNKKAQKETREIQGKKLRKLAASGNSDIFIDGEPVSDDFDLDGIRLKDYEIKFKNGKVYLISY